MIEAGNGVLLISDPFLKDPNFMRTVVLLCEHNEEGSFGFVINRTYNKNIGDLVIGFEEINEPVYYGGPVQLDSLHFIHQLPAMIPGAKKVTEGIYWGGDFEILSDLIKKGELDFSKIRFFIGYSGWSDGQLNNELTEKSWLTVKANRKLVFHADTNAIWKEALETMGGEFKQLVNYPIDPQLN
jgi:putative transcriptional regulator